MKTHKTIEGAERQVRGGFRGITVSTLAEAESYAAHGFRDITYGVTDHSRQGVAGDLGVREYRCTLSASGHHRDGERAR